MQSAIFLAARFVILLTIRSFSRAICSCSPVTVQSVQVYPFAENFHQFSKLSQEKEFTQAVQMSLNMDKQAASGRCYAATVFCNFCILHCCVLVCTACWLARPAGCMSLSLQHRGRFFFAPLEVAKSLAQPSPPHACILDAISALCCVTTTPHKHPFCTSHSVSRQILSTAQRAISTHSRPPPPPPQPTHPSLFFRHAFLLSFPSRHLTHTCSRFVLSPDADRYFLHRHTFDTPFSFRQHAFSLAHSFPAFSPTDVLPADPFTTARHYVADYSGEGFSPRLFANRQPSPSSAPDQSAISIPVGTQVMIRGIDDVHHKLRPYAKTPATVIDVPVHPNTWYGVRLYDNKCVKIR